MTTTILTWVLACVLGSSFVACALLIMTQRWHGKHSLDHDLHGTQKIHHAPVPRVGGIGLVIGLSLGIAIGFALGSKTYPLSFQMLYCAAPVFVAGLLEDLTKKVSVRTRLFASFVSAACATYALNAQLTRLDSPGLDVLIGIWPISVIFTCFAVGGLTNAINIIDGLNGLASGCVAIMLTGLATIAWQAGDVIVIKLCLWGVAALVGFLILNFPFGRIFLGDGGAYLVGFWLAECAVLLLMRNPRVSTWSVLLTCFYPVWETLFSMYRRHMISRVSSSSADSGHLHHRLYRSISRSIHFRGLPTWLHHGLATMYIWAMVTACQLYAVYFPGNSSAAAFGLLLFVLAYMYVYRTTPLEAESGGSGTNNTFNNSAQI
jgi:UDP-N-acetylmuramyl pentapeptide phosphotransferase/UDP-N-acetylglucosamine-1-phosphate transferase